MAEQLWCSLIRRATFQFLVQNCGGRPGDSCGRSGIGEKNRRATGHKARPPRSQRHSAMDASKQDAS